MAVSVVLCETIINIVLTVFNNFVKATANKTYTYRQVIYLKKLHDEMVDCLQLPSENYTQVILDRLLYLNFNSEQFINKYSKHIMLQVAEASTIKDQLEILAWWLKTINQAAVKPGMALLINANGAHQKMICWLQDEIHFIEKRNQLAITMF